MKPPEQQIRLNWRIEGKWWQPAFASLQNETIDHQASNIPETK
jgi:hypothetical protein